MKEKGYRKSEVVAVILFLVLLFAATAEAAVKLKVAVVNPSTTVSQTTLVKFDLPKGIAPEHIVDIGDMELKYDFGKGIYYVSKMVTLEPAQKLVLEVKLLDVWSIPNEELTFLGEHVSTLMEKLENTKHSGIGATLCKKIKDSLAAVAKLQEEASLNMKEKINLYYENIEILNGIKGDIGMLENLVIDVGGVVEERVEVPATLAVSVIGEKEPMAEEETVELNVKISNPSEKRKQITPIKYILPEEITPRHILDCSGLEAAYDFSKECFYVYNDAVELEPSETKVFTVKVRDIWRIPKLEIEALNSHTNNLMLLLEETEYFNQGKLIADKIFFNLDQIAESQSKKVEVARHIAYYRDNTSTLDQTRKYVAQLEKIVTQSGSSPGVTIARAERIEGGGPEVKRPTGYEGLRFIAESIFKGKAPTVATTWKIVFTILAFIGIVGATFYILWYIQSRK
ncbi:MAG: hypothetical protein ISS34_05850 [Candidatus Omnitrophica bacterium]|nr:hypothetical protein [Candidatus Omnitrophota bacterium]